VPDQLKNAQDKWNWLQGTYWYVPNENLAALQLDTGDHTLNWVVDQTVWNITGYRDGYFWGISATLVENPEQNGSLQKPAHPVCFSMLGSITPDGKVHLTFVPKVGPLRTPTIGIGGAVLRKRTWSFEMQMSSGSSTQTAHWAYMMPIEPNNSDWNSLPGVGLTVPEMLQGCPAPQPGSSGPPNPS
jgi:hypothetical protein